MFCPNCGQQQIAGSTKFCPRCGTPLAGLAEWLAAGGTLVPATAAERRPAPLTPRRKGMRRGAKLMFLSGVLLPVFILMSFAVENPGPVIIPPVLFFAGLSMLLYARLFGDDDAPPAPAISPAQQFVPGTAQGVTTLPPAADARINDFARRGVRTAELVRPPSVTENTTRLLDDE